jgi:hypothetical protein
MTAFTETVPDRIDFAMVGAFFADYAVGSSEKQTVAANRIDKIAMQYDFHLISPCKALQCFSSDYFEVVSLLAVAR